MGLPCQSYQLHSTLSEIVSLVEKRLYRLQFSFVVSLIFGLTEQFEIVCLPEKLLTRRDPRKVLMCRFVRFLNEHFRMVYRAFGFM